MSIRRVDNPPNPWTGNVELDYDLGEAPRAELEVYEEQARSILARNNSPDIPQRYTLNPYRGCYHGCAFCMGGETLILMADGSRKPLADIRVGDVIYGTRRDGRYRRYVHTEVRAHWRTRKPAFEITLEDGRQLIASADHRFLTFRGWKYVKGRMSGTGQRPYLTTNNRLYGPGPLSKQLVQSADFKRGYLSGMIRGDGLLASYDYSGRRRAHDVQHQFRLALTDTEALERSRTFLRVLGVQTRRFVFSKATATAREAHGIRTHARDSCNKIEALIAWPMGPSREWARGFVSGFFDAEGSSSGGILRMYNTDASLIDVVKAALEKAGFDVCTELRPRRRPLHVLRVLGGLPEHLRFLQYFDPAITRKRDFSGQAIKNSVASRVVSIEPLHGDRELFDITTGTGDFIADGVISHNCYARPFHQYLGFGAGSDFERRIVVKVNAPEKLRETFDKPSWAGETILFSGVTDCYQPLEASYELTRRCLEVCRDYRQPVAIITRSALIRRDLDVLAELARRAHLRVFLSIGYGDDTIGRALEPHASAISQRFVTLRRLSEAGITCGVAVAPIIPGLGDSAVPEILTRAAEAGATRAFITLLRLPDGTRQVFEKAIAEAYPERAGKVLRGLESMRGGQRDERRFGERMRGHGPRWRAIVQLFQVHCRRLGLSFEERNEVDGFDSPTTTFRRPGTQGTLFD